MSRPTEDMIRVSRQIGDELGDSLAGFALHANVNRGFSAKTILESVKQRINQADPDLQRQTRGDARDEEVGTRMRTQMDRFMGLLAIQELAVVDRLPLLRIENGGEQRLVSIDVRNAQAVKSVESLVRGEAYASDNARASLHDQANRWQRIAEVAPFVELKPQREVARDFFNLFTLDYWTARKSVSSGGKATLYYEVDCTSSGYQLEYWPQFLYSPTVFGANLTRPVAATIPVNHYCFQGWKSNKVTIDGGVYFADPKNPKATLRAF